MNDVTTATAAHLEADETHQLISSEKVDGTSVYDRRGESLGSIHHLMIDKKYWSGRLCSDVVWRLPRDRRELSSTSVENADL